MKSIHYLLALFLFLGLFSAPPCSLVADDVPYEVHFVGIDDEDLISTLKTISELFTLQDSPPGSKIALKRRAEADIGNIVKGLHSYGYYNAKVDLDIDTDQTPAQITFRVDLGETYPLASFIIIPFEKENCDEEPFPYDTVTVEKLGLEIGEPALPKTILKAEGELLLLMAKQGYTLATIKKRDVIADQSNKTISVKLTVDSGPIVYFGTTVIEGLTSVQECAVRKKIAWKVNETYDPCLVEETLNDIEATGLFTSVSIDPDNVTDKDHLLPITIQLIEAKHRTIGGGISYNTQIGPGVIASWENRNMRGLGERLSFHADIAQKLQTGKLLYEQYDFLVPKQNLLWIAEATGEQTKGFNDTSFGLSAIIDRTINSQLRVSYGTALEEIRTTKSNDNGNFFLIKFPLSGRWSTANSLLNPTKGQTVHLKVIPTTQVLHSGGNQIVKPGHKRHSSGFYCINTITGIWYQPLTEDHRFMLATKASLGSIWGSSDISIPPPDRFYLGSESTLRGYNYLTVSPIVDNKPIGGRSLILFVLEARYRFNEEFGGVAFYELGNAYEEVLPQFNKKILQSVGGGLRYHTAVGPLRFDVAFPLNKRKGIDRAFQFYLSIGQSF